MLNRTKEKKPKHMPAESHENYMGGPSYDLSPFARLYVMACSSFFGEDGYYNDIVRQKDNTDTVFYLEKWFGTYGLAMTGMFSGKNRAEAMRQAIEDSLAYDTKLTLLFLAWLRTKALIRSTPAVGLAVACHSDTVRKYVAEHGTGALRTASKDILYRLDDTTNCLSYYLKTFGKPIPNSLKKILAERLSRASGYELAKYAGNKKEVTLLDVIRLTHAHSEHIDRFYRGEIKQDTEGQETWEAILSAEGSSEKSWTKAVGVMGHMALLRNLRNLEKNHVDTFLYLPKLVIEAKIGKQLPFRYFSAWKNVSSADVKKALETCLDESVANLPKLLGRSLILVDNSGSALGTHVSALSNVSVSDCGNLMGVLTGLVSDEGRIGVFGDRIKYVPINKNFKGTALEMHRTVNELGETVGQATENGIWLALRDIIHSKEKFDRIFIYSDMQAGHGGLYGTDSGYPVYNEVHKARYSERYIDVPALVAQYRKEVNPDCKLYSVQIGGYGDSIFPEFYPDTCILSGWSPELLKFVEMFEKNPATVEEQFRTLFGMERKR